MDAAHIYAGPVFTGVRERPWADAVAVQGSNVVGVGSLAELRNEWPGAFVEGFDGRMVTPGFVDAHNHFLSTGESLASLDLRFPKVDSAPALLALIRLAVTPASQ